MIATVAGFDNTRRNPPGTLRRGPLPAAGAPRAASVPGAGPPREANRAAGDSRIIPSLHTHGPVRNMKLELATDRMIARIEDGIGWVIYNNPKRLNAISLEMTEALPLIFDTFEERDDVRVVVVRGAGSRAFVSGADISEFEKNRSSEESRRIFDEKGKIAAARVEALGKPIIAMIHGYCIGGGLMTALRADVRIASEDAQFGIPAARLGLGYGHGGVAALVDLVGPAAANEILFSARRFSADEALRMGLVNRVVTRSALEPAVVDLARSIADNAPLTVRAAKFAIRQCVKDRAARDLDEAARLVEACFRSEDYVEGRRAFMEKRRPVFRGR